MVIVEIIIQFVREGTPKYKNMEKNIVSFFCLVAIFSSVQSTRYDYEFGTDHVGSVVFVTRGDIEMEWTKNVYIPVLDHITYVKVTVYALSPPKVDYDSILRKVSIVYSWTQIPLSSYEIIAKGVPY